MALQHEGVGRHGFKGTAVGPVVDWSRRHCRACEGEQDLLPDADVDAALKTLDGWRRDGAWIERDLRFADFRSTIDFVDRVAEVAEAEGHHPDLSVHGYRNVTLRLQTHAVGGLTENDLILAAKVDALA